MSLYKTHGDRLETTEKRSQVLIFTFSGIEWHVEQRKLQERILVDILSELRCAIQTEKPARSDICGCPFWFLTKRPSLVLLEIENHFHFC